MTFVVAAIGAGAGYLASGPLGVSALTGALGGAGIGGVLIDIKRSADALEGINIALSNIAGNYARKG